MNVDITTIHGREGNFKIGRRRCTWEDNIKMDLKDVGFEDVDCINMAEDRV